MLYISIFILLTMCQNFHLFDQLRTHALAALHGGLQNNQGIPVAHVAHWLGMEVNSEFISFD